MLLATLRKLPRRTSKKELVHIVLSCGEDRLGPRDVDFVSRGWIGGY